MKSFLSYLAATTLLLGSARAEDTAKTDAPGTPTATPVASTGRNSSGQQVIDANNVEVVTPTHRVSGTLNASITSILPRYQPPPPPAPVKESTEKKLEDGSTEVDDPEAEMSSDPEAPRNKIIRLPKQVVQASRPPIFKEREIHTKKGLSDLAVQRYLNKFDSKVLNRFTIPLFGTSNEDRAMAMYYEDERLQNMQDLKDTAEALQRSGDASGAEYLRKESNRTFMRSGGMDWTMPKD